MRKLSILYISRTRDRAFHRALARYGAVSYAEGINRALFLMAETDFHYYFVDADVPQAHAYLKHLRHDPQLMPPAGVILLTGNRDEDCEAWSVDMFINRESAPGELPYVFSHLRAEDREPANVLRLAEYGPAEGEPSPRDEPAAEPAAELEDAEARDVDPRDFFGRDTGGERENAQACGEAPSRRSAFAFTHEPAGRPPGNASRHWAKVAAMALLVVCVGFWAFAWGPLKKQPVRKQAASAGRKTPKAGSSGGGVLFSVPGGYGSQSPPAAAQPATAPASPGSTALAGEKSPANDPVSPQPAARPDTPPPEAEPAPARENRAPSVSISGPTQVVHGETATYTASASDPDGDAVSLSWTVKVMCWSTPGLYRLSVTGTDSRGASRGGEISVRVI